MKHTDPYGNPITRKPGTAPRGTVALRVSGNDDGTGIAFAFQDGGISEYLKSVTSVTTGEPYVF